MIAHTIQLSVAPVFLLVAIGNLLNLISTRLGRVVDRARHLEQRHPETSGAEHDMIVAELRSIDRRATLVNRAILLLVLAGLAIGMTVTALFIEEIAGIALEHFAAVLFLIAVTLLMAGLLSFLFETRLAGQSIRIRRDYLEHHRRL